MSQFDNVYFDDDDDGDNENDECCKDVNCEETQERFEIKVALQISKPTFTVIKLDRSARGVTVDLDRYWRGKKESTVSVGCGWLALHMDWQSGKLLAAHSHGSRTDIFFVQFTISELNGSNRQLSLVNAFVEVDGSVSLQPIDANLTLGEDLERHMIAQCRSVMEKENEFVEEQRAWKFDAERIARLINGQTVEDAIRLLTREGYF